MKLGSDHNMSVNSGTFLSNISLVIPATDSKHFLYNTHLLKMDTFSSGFFLCVRGGNVLFSY